MKTEARVDINATNKILFSVRAKSWLYHSHVLYICVKAFPAADAALSVYKVVLKLGLGSNKFIASNPRYQTKGGLYVNCRV